MHVKSRSRISTATAKERAWERLFHGNKTVGDKVGKE